MPSVTELNVPAEPNCRRQLPAVLKLWNRKLHYYVGLYLLFFVWLFAFTGLVLNHPKWTFDEFWDSRRQTADEREIAAPGSSAEGDL